MFVKRILLPIIALLMLTACGDEQDFDLLSTEQKGITFTVPDFADETDSRVSVVVDSKGAHFSWEEGDTLGVFPNEGYQTAFPINGGTGTNSALFDGAGWALRPNSEYAAYYPFAHPMDAVDKSAIKVSYLGQKQAGNGTTSHLGKYDYLASNFKQVSAAGNVDFTLRHLGCLVRFQLTMPAADRLSSMTLSCDGVNLTTEGVYSLLDETPALAVADSASELTLSFTSMPAVANRVITLYMMLPPMNLKGKNLTIQLRGIHEYVATVAGKDMKAGVIYGYSAVASNANAGHAYVDLGLTSGTKWATCNVGATTPEEYGNYYAWGETKAYKEEDTSNTRNFNYTGTYIKTYYYWSTYKWCNGSSSSMTKYCTNSSYGTVDNKTTLVAADDAASVNWGSTWRMPTSEEEDELRSECTWTWTTLNGVNGYNVEGPNGNSIFLPAAGERSDGSLSSAGSYGGYWSSSLYNRYSGAAYFLSLSSSSIDWYGYSRCYGYSIRPVFR